MKNKTWLLYTGIPLIITYFIYAFTVTNPEISLPLEAAMNLFPMWAFLVFAIVIAPLIEEYAFRIWQRTDKKRYWLPPVIFSFYVLSSGHIYAGILSVIFVLCYWIFFKNIKTIHIVIVTSLLFGLIHLPEDYASYHLYFHLAGFLGIALVLSYLNLRFGIQYAMLFHFLWNFTFLYLVNISSFPMKTEVYSLSTSTDNIILKQYSVFDNSSDQYHTSGPNKVEINGSDKKGILSYFYPNNAEQLVKYQTNPFTRYQLFIAPASQPGFIDAKAAREKIIPLLNVRIDSADEFKDGYELSLPDKTTIKTDTSNEAWMNMFYYSASIGSVSSFANALQKRYAIPFATGDTTWIDVSYNGSLSVESQLRELHEKHGFNFKKVRKKIRVITISDK